MTTPSTTSTEKPKKPEKPGAAYKETLNLPQTSFPMEAKLVQNEPARLKTWDETRLYEKILAARAKSPRWVLHDGPPFANADIHIGHVINHVLKDVVIRFRTMQGYLSPYIPGWDCHGLPIEHLIQQKLGAKIREMPPEEVRRLCHEHAQKFIDVQRQQVKRLGMLGEWENPYVTMSPTYEASQLEVFAKFVQAGLVFKKLRPVPWSVANRTALAEDSVELEYRDVEDPSIYVEFPAVNPGQVKGLFDARLEGTVSFLVWTTTPWTLPANLAIAVHPEHQYVAVKYMRNGKERLGVVVAELLERVFKGRAGVQSFEVVGKPVKGSDLVAANLEYQHPFVERRGKILPAMYVTTTDGTGLVHTAPGHGMEDYVTGLAHGLPVYSPVQADGRFDETAPEFIRGKTVWEANPLVIDRLMQSDVLLDQQTIRHSYPHDWRSKTPVIQRAAEQWFFAVDKPFVAADEPPATTPRTLRERAQHAINNDVKWVPEWGKRRIGGMVEVRPDWSISRQRAWGLPIPAFYNPQGEALLTPESVRAVARHVREHGSNIWYTWTPAELLGADFVYPPGFSKDDLRKEQDTFDVGFDSGTSWHAVLYGNSRLDFPCEMYLEGADQHRLWFQLSLLASLGATGRPPFNEVLTHGFVVKPDGTKVSKSDKEYVTATKEIETHGADLLRLWCCSVDYENDIPASPQAIKVFGDKYRKIRNTLKYLLSNLYDFDPRRDAQQIPPNSLDGWAMAELDNLIVETTKQYDAYLFHHVFRLLHDFCAVQISAIYGNAMKDRLYCEAPNSPLRRRAQTVMYRMLIALTKLLAPVIVFTADEVWEYTQHKPDEDRDLGSVHLALLPKPSGQAVSDEQREEWKLLMDLRDQALSQLDKLTRQIGKYKALDAEVIYRVDDDALRRKLQAYGPDLEDLVGAGCWSFAEKGTEGPAVTVEVVDRRQTYNACARSWKRRPDVGQDPEFPDLTLRDAAAVKARRT
jgi:isoleucyl-tRNA synthetase